MKHLYRLLPGHGLSGRALGAHARTGAVDVGTATPDANAALDILAGTAANKGLLVPRLTDTQRTDPPLGVADGSQPHNNMPPYQCIGFCLALYGIYPSRN